MSTMKRIFITGMLFIFSISYCGAQSLQEAVEAQKQREAQQQQAAEAQRRQQQAAAEQQRRELEQNYQNAIESAQKNVDEGHYVQAKQDYLSALELKPETANVINPKIAEIDKLVVEEEKRNAEAELERRYQEAIASAERNFNQGQYAQAKQDYQAALEIKPENADFVKTKIADLDKPAVLYIYRKRKALDLLPKRYDIYLDNVIVGNSTNNWKTTATVMPVGLKKVSADIDGRQVEVQMNFAPGGEYYIRSDVDSKSVDTGQTKTTTDKNGKTTTSAVKEMQYTQILQLVDKSLGESEFKAIVVK